MELDGWKFLLIGLLIVALILSITSIVISSQCSKTCKNSSNLGGTNTPSNLGAGESEVGPTGPTGPAGPTLSTSFAIAYGYATFPARSTQPTSIKLTKGCTIVRDSTYWSYTITFDNSVGTAYSIVGNAEAYAADYQGEKGSLICSVISSTMTSKSVQLRVNVSGGPTSTAQVYTGDTFISFVVAG